MANTYKNIVITTNIGSATDDPKIVFSGANTTTNTDITLRVYPTSNGTVSFEGSAGQLFSVTNQLTGTLFSVNDVSGIPSIEVLDTGLVKLAQYNGNVGIGTANASYKLDVNGTARISGNLVFSNTTSNGITFADGTRQTVAYNPNIDTTQNTRITVIEGTDVSQNVRLDWSNTAIAATDGKMTSAYGVANTADVRSTAAYFHANGAFIKANAAFDAANVVAGGLTTANARMTIIEGVDATQNTNISNKVNLTGSLNQTISGNVTIGQDLIVSGNLVISGNINSQNVQQLAVADPLIVLGIGNYSSDTKDIGFAAHYNDGTNAHAGLIRDAGTKEFYVFQGYTPELDANNNVIITDASFTKANLNANYVKSNLIATTIVVNGIDLNTYSSAAYAQANVTVGVDTTQNTRLTVLEGTDASQNVRIDYSNTVIAATDGKMQNAYFQANGAFIRANAAFDASNVVAGGLTTANARMTIIEGVDATQNISITVADTRSIAAYFHANGAFIKANAAFDYANTIINSGNSIDNVARANANAAYFHANGAFIKANAAFDTANTADVRSTAAYFHANGAFIKANAAFDAANATNGKMESAYFQANGAFIKANAAFDYANTISNNAIDSVARETANAAYFHANGAFIKANAAFDTANTADVRSTAAYFHANGAFIRANAAFDAANVVAGGLTTANSRMTIIEGVDSGQNTSIAATDGKMQNAYFQANGAFIKANAAFDAANAVVSSISATNGKMESAYFQANGAFIKANAAFDAANASFAGVNTAITIIQGVNASQNVRLDYSNTAITVIQGTDTSQNVRLDWSNTSISATDNKMQSAYTQANTAITNVAATDGKMQSSYNQANTDVTNLSATPGTYGSSSLVPVFTLAANGRVTSVTNTTVTTPVPSGYLPNSVIFANTAGYLSNTSSLQFFTSNNTLVVANSISLATSATASNSIYVGGRVGFASNNISVVYQVYNANTNSLDTIFG